MKNTMEYKDYVGTVEFSAADRVFFGKVIGIKSLISYEGTTADELIEDFHQAVDEYLELCQANGTVPEKAYKGSFNVRIAPELHKKLAISAIAENISLNRCIEKAVQQYIAGII